MSALIRKIGRFGPEKCSQRGFRRSGTRPLPDRSAGLASWPLRRWRAANAATGVALGCGRAILSDFQPLSNDRFIRTCIV